MSSRYSALMMPRFASLNALLRPMLTGAMIALMAMPAVAEAEVVTATASVRIVSAQVAIRAGQIDLGAGTRQASGGAKVAVLMATPAPSALRERGCAGSDAACRVIVTDLP